jgi:hypothetical protein
LSENLSEALRAGSKGENLSGAPLLSFQKKKKKKKKKKKNNKHNKSFACRCSMEEKKPLHSKPGAFIMLSKDVINTSSKNNNVFQGMCNFHHDLDLLQEDTVFYRNRQSSYRKTQIFYRKVQNFYRKLCVLQETSCRRLRRPKCVLNEDLATEEWIECMHATDGTPEHCYYLARPSSSPCKQDPCSSTTKQ